MVGLGVVHGNEQLRGMSNGNRNQTHRHRYHQSTAQRTQSLPYHAAIYGESHSELERRFLVCSGLAGWAFIHFGLHCHRRLVHEIGIRPQTVLELAPIKYRIGEGVVIRKLGEALDEALSLYRQAEIAPARERRVRILDKRGDTEAAQQLLAQIAQAPLSATEQIFGERFGQRGAGYQPPTTVWSIDHDCNFETPTVENFVLHTLLQHQGGWGMHSENA